MAEFSETMHKWKRMCDYYGDTCGSKPNRCPLADLNGVCEAMYTQIGDEDWESAERIISEWHEPAYPTWREYLNKLQLAGLFEYENDADLLDTPIHADIAQKLGIEPKEG